MFLQISFSHFLFVFLSFVLLSLSLFVDLSYFISGHLKFISFHYVPLRCVLELCGAEKQMGEMVIIVHRFFKSTFGVSKLQQSGEKSLDYWSYQHVASLQLFLPQAKVLWCAYQHTRQWKRQEQMVPDIEQTFEKLPRGESCGEAVCGK